MRFLDSLIVEQQQRFVFWVRNISIMLLCVVMGGLLYAVYAFDQLADVSTPATCYVGNEIVWKGVMRGVLSLPARSRPWRFVDAETSKPVILTIHCEATEKEGD